mgnify:CR=1 FL=1
MNARLTAPDRLEQITAVVIGVTARHRLCLVVGHRLDTLVGDEVVLDPELRACRIHPQVGVRSVAIHLAPVARQAALAAAQFTEELVEVDTQVLTSDLPIKAYLDEDFQAWLKQSSE